MKDAASAAIFGSRAAEAYVFPPFASKQALIVAILLKRRIELLGDGFRAADAQRRQLRSSSWWRNPNF